MESEIPPPGLFSAAEAVNMSEAENYDMRPHIFDGVSKKHLLLDSGSQVTAYPPDPGDKVDPSMSLKAVNGTRLKCYGYKEVSVRINRKKYDIRAIKTDVENPILGWNFVRKHRLTLDWSPWGDAEIIDKRAKIKQILKYKAIPSSQPRKLSKLETSLDSPDSPEASSSSSSSHAFAFETACMSALEEELDTVINDIETMPESQFKDLIKKYPDILKLNFDTVLP